MDFESNIDLHVTEAGCLESGGLSSGIMEITSSPPAQIQNTIADNSLPETEHPNSASVDELPLGFDLQTAMDQEFAVSESELGIDGNTNLSPAWLLDSVDVSIPNEYSLFERRPSSSDPNRLGPDTSLNYLFNFDIIGPCPSPIPFLKFENDLCSQGRAPNQELESCSAYLDLP